MVDPVYTVGESSGVVSVCVQLQGEMEGTGATVELSTQSGTASESGERLHCQQQLTLSLSLFSLYPTNTHVSFLSIPN